jgi:hypothetical protein
MDYVTQTISYDVKRADILTDRLIKQYLWLIAQERDYFLA